MRNGTASTVLFGSGCQRTISRSASVSASCRPNFVFAERPFRVRSFTTSSHTPIRPKPAVARRTTHTYRLTRFAHSMVETRIEARMMMPPIVGVPFFVRWRSGVSSRIVSPPCCFSRSRVMIHGPITSEITSAEMRAMKDRNVR